MVNYITLFYTFLLIEKACCDNDSASTICRAYNIIYVIIVLLYRDHSSWGQDILSTLVSDD